MRVKISEQAAAIFTRYNLIVWAFCALFAAIAGPFGTMDADDFWYRLLYWSVIIPVSTVFGRFFTLMSRKHIGPGRPLLADLATMAGMGAAFTPVLALMNALLLNPSLAFRFSSITLLGFVLAVTGAVCLVRRFLLGLESHDTGGLELPVETELPTGLPRLARRLPDDFGGPILHIMVRDHCVEVATPNATHKIRMRFADAIDEMDTVPGHCTHRSHWVASDAIDAVERDGSRILLRLTNGSIVPVSRSYRQPLQAAGVL